jgi:hypothetical protein
LWSLEDPEGLFANMKLHKCADGKFTFVNGKGEYKEPTEKKQEKEQNLKPPTEVEIEREKWAKRNEQAEYW